jgi:hypothetical protein
LPDPEISLDRLKVIVLAVIWRYRHEVDALILEELLAEEATTRIWQRRRRHPHPAELNPGLRNWERRAYDAPLLTRYCPRNTIQTMSKQLIIAEKPSVAQDIAKALGGFAKHRRLLRERRLRAVLGHRPPAGTGGARGIRRQARQVELHPFADDSAAFRAESDRKTQERLRC